MNPASAIGHGAPDLDGWHDGWIVPLAAPGLRGDHPEWL
jgi:hypothetical protein